MRFFLIFILTFLILFLFFYFYPAPVFEAKIQGGITEITADVSLQTILFKDGLTDPFIAENIISVNPTLKGILLLLICLAGLPLMIALRFGRKKQILENESE